MAYALQTFAPSHAAVVTHDSGRFPAVVRTHCAFVWRTVRRFGVPSSDADDAVQETFMVLARKLTTVDEGGEKWFLFHAAIHIALHWRRSHARRREDAVDHDGWDHHQDDAPTPDEVADMRQRLEMLDRCLEALPVELRTVLVLCELEQVTMAEAAVALDVPAGTVASRLRRAREALEHAAQAIVGTQP